MGFHIPPKAFHQNFFHLLLFYYHIHTHTPQPVSSCLFYIIQPFSIPFTLYFLFLFLIQKAKRPIWRLGYVQLERSSRQKSNKSCLWIGVGESFLENPFFLKTNRILPPLSLTRLAPTRVPVKKVLPLMDPLKGLDYSMPTKTRRVWSMDVTLTSPIARIIIDAIGYAILTPKPLLWWLEERRNDSVNSVAGKNNQK